MVYILLFSMRMHGSQTRSGNFQRKKNVLFLPGIEPQFISFTVATVLTALLCFAEGHSLLHGYTGLLGSIVV